VLVGKEKTAMTPLTNLARQLKGLENITGQSAADF
jgi:hypothetical protein